MFNQSQYARIYCSAWLNNGIQSSSLCRRLKLILWALSHNAKRESTQLSQSTVHLCVWGGKQFALLYIWMLIRAEQLMVTQPVKFIAPSGCRRSFVHFQSVWAATQILMDSGSLCSVSVWPCLEKAKVKRNWLEVELESCSVVTSAVSLCQNRRARSRNMSHILFRTWSCTNKNCSTAHHPTHRNYKFDLQREFLFVFLEEV